MYTKDAVALIDPDSIEPKYSHKRLPQLIEYHARNPDVRVSNEYFELLCNWLKKLEQNYYKTAQHKSESKYDKRIDRAVLFIQFTRENAHKDGALLMSMWRWAFANVEVLLMCQQMRVGIAQDRETVLAKLRHPDVEYFKQLLAIELNLSKHNKQFTLENAVHEWKQYKSRYANRTQPGKRATDTFITKYHHFREVFSQRGLLERSWCSKYDGSFSAV